MKTNKDRLIHDLMVIPEYWLLREFWDGDQDEETEQPALTEHSCDCILRVVEKLTAEMQERKCPIRTCFEEDIAALTVIAGFKDAVAGTGYEECFARLSEKTYAELRKDIVAALRNNGYSVRE